MEIQKNVAMLESSPQSHVFLVLGKENILIDTGFPGVGKKILRELKEMGVDPKSIRHILLTHHDVDHIGNVKLLCEITGAQVWASAEDIPYIAREKKRPGIKRLIGFLMRPGIPLKIRPYAAHQRFGELLVTPAPGHTPGHVVISSERLLFAGDLIRTRNGIPEPMPKSMNWDNGMALRSIGILQSLDPDRICSSHGQPLEVTDAVRIFFGPVRITERNGYDAKDKTGQDRNTGRGSRSCRRDRHSKPYLKPARGAARDKVPFSL